MPVFGGVKFAKGHIKHIRQCKGVAILMLSMAKQNKIVFTNKPSVVGKNKQMVIYVPAVIKRLIDLDKEYKITLEELEVNKQ